LCFVQRYAVLLPPGLPRIEHWSRRLDTSGIHFSSAFIAYGTSGSLTYFVLNAIYNAVCIRFQFEKKIRPIRNRTCLLVSMLAYTTPIIWQGNKTCFASIWSILAIALWMFAAYPIGGWSHAAFHVFWWFVPPLLLEFACSLPVSQDQILMAARCSMPREE